MNVRGGLVYCVIPNTISDVFHMVNASNCIQRPKKKNRGATLFKVQYRRMRRAGRDNPNVGFHKVREKV